MEIIANEGISNLIMKRIAGLLDITDAALYKHFESKGEMLLFLVDRLETSVLDNFNNSLSSKKQDKALLKHVLKSQMEFIENNLEVPTILFAGALHFDDSKVVNRVNEVVESYSKAIEKLMNDLKREGYIDENTDIKNAVTLFIGMIQASFLKWMTSDYSYEFSSTADDLWKTFSKCLE